MVAEMFFSLSASNTIQDVIRTNISFSNSNNCLIWKLDYRGFFTIKSAWNSIRTPNYLVDWAQFVWQHSTPLKISMVGQKLYRNVLLFDANIQTKNISDGIICNI